MFEREYARFESKRKEFLSKHLGEFVVIQGEAVKGFFKTEMDAFKFMKDQELGSFMVQQCISEDEETARYASRVVAFA